MLDLKTKLDILHIVTVFSKSQEAFELLLKEKITLILDVLVCKRNTVYFMKFRRKRNIAIFDFANCQHSTRAIRSVAESYGFKVDLYDRWVEDDFVEDLASLEKPELVIINSHGTIKKGLIMYADVYEEYTNTGSNKNYHAEKREDDHSTLYTFFAGTKFFEQHKKPVRFPNNLYRLRRCAIRQSSKRRTC